jgi:hypothetical protein
MGDDDNRKRVHAMEPRMRIGTAAGKPGRGARARLVGIAWAVVLLLPACQPKPQQQPQQQLGSSRNAPVTNDTKVIERMEMMRTRALGAPGGISEALDFADYVTLIFSQGISARWPVPPALVEEAVASLERARKDHPAETADLLAEKGELLLAAGRTESGASALRDSIAARPSLRAFTPLAKLYAAQKLSTEIVALCKRTLPMMKSEESRYAVLDDCLRYSGANTPEVGLSWAPHREVSFYKARHRELETLEAARQRRTTQEVAAEQKRVSKR